MGNGLIPFSPIDLLHNPGQITQPLKASPFPSAKWKQNVSSSVRRWPQDIWRIATDTPKWVLYIIHLLAGTATWSMEPASGASCGHRRVWFPIAGLTVTPWTSESSVVELGSTQRTHPASLLLHSVLPAGMFCSVWLLAFLHELIQDRFFFGC